MPARKVQVNLDSPLLIPYISSVDSPGVSKAWISLHLLCQHPGKRPSCLPGLWQYPLIWAPSNYSLIYSPHSIPEWFNIYISYIYIYVYIYISLKLFIGTSDSNLNLCIGLVGPPQMHLSLSCWVFQPQLFSHFLRQLTFLPACLWAHAFCHGCIMTFAGSRHFCLFRFLHK